MKKIISFSLWGNDPKYTIGAIRNAELTPTIFPGWISRFYCGLSVPTNIIETLKSLPYTEVIMMDVDGDWTGMFWRFYACGDSDVMLSRDTDSRITIREKLAVDEWLDSDKNFHIMRDHPHHTTQILGGMWGARNGILKNIQELINNYYKGNFWQVDQNFLRDVIYPMIESTSYVHDEFFKYNSNSKPFPIKREYGEFIGGRIGVDDKPIGDDYKLVI
jgi:hypothetical protein